MSLPRTPPLASATKTNYSKRVRSDDEHETDCDDTPQNLTLEVVLQAMNKQFEKTLTRMEEINTNISGKIDAVKAELDGKLEAVMHDINKFKADCTLNLKSNEDALCSLSGRVGEISQEIDTLENRNELIVSGIPYLKNENLKLYFKAMWKQIGLEEDCNPLVDLRRLGRQGTQGDGLILVQFALRNNRDDFYSRYLQKRDLKLCHLGINSQQRIYVNENLTVAARKLKAAALRLKKAGKLSSVYTRLGVVMVKRSVDQQPVPIQSEQHLDQFIR